MALAAFSLPALAAAPAPTPPLDAAAKREAVEGAAKLLRDTYVFPELGTQAADRITAALAAGDYDAAKDARAFAVRVTQDLEAVTHDRHLAMIPRVEAQMTLARTRTGGGFARVDRLKGNIGYAKLDRFAPLGLFTPFADEAMRKLAATDALVLDLRDNDGGAESSAIYMASAFFDPARPVHVADLVGRTPGADAFTTTTLSTVPTPAPYLGKPVYILVSARTFSAGEELANDLKVLGRAVVVGETTGGGANPGNSWALLKGELRVFIPSSRAENPVTKTNWEGTGVVPDLPAPEGQALPVALNRLTAELDAAGKGAALAPLKARLKPGVAEAALVDAPLMTLRTAAQPGGEAALRKLMADIATGHPDYATMEPDIAAARRGAGPMQPRIAALGAVKTLRFRGVNAYGADEYDVFFEHGAAVWMIYLMPDGKLAAYGVSLG